MTTAAAGVLPDRSIGKWERLCLERIARHHREWPAKGYYYDIEAAERVVTFIEEYCRHYKGEWAGQPMLLSEWQKRCLLEAFGWFNEAGFRVVRSVWIEVARKNGKSQFAAAVGMYLLVADHEPGAEVYSSATKRDQARIVFNAARAIVRQNKELRKHVKVQRTQLLVDRTDSKFEPLSADAHTLDGLDPHGNIIDEIHAHRTREVWDVLDTAMGARRQPMTWVITTAGVYDPEQIGWQQHEYAQNILEGIFEDDSLLIYMCAADDDIPWDSTEAIEQANPNLGISVKAEYLAIQCTKARAQASFTNTYRRLHTNQWTQAHTLWLKLEDWRACAGELPPKKYLATLPCWGGLDLSSKVDLTAMALAFYDERPDPEDEDAPALWYLAVEHFMPADDIVERSREDKVPYDRWAEQGYITLTPGNVIDYDFIIEHACDSADRFDLLELAYDPWNAMQTAVKLQSEGLTVVEMRQGYATLSEPTKEFESLIISQQLRHGGNPVLAWEANNVVVVEDPAGNIKPDKQKSRRRIDGIVAGIMAIGRGIISDGGRSVYEDRWLTILQ